MAALDRVRFLKGETINVDWSPWDRAEGSDQVGFFGEIDTGFLLPGKVYTAKEIKRAKNRREYLIRKQKKETRKYSKTSAHWD